MPLTGTSLVPSKFALLELDFLRDIHYSNTGIKYPQRGGRQSNPKGAIKETVQTFTDASTKKTYHFTLSTETDEGITRLSVYTEDGNDCVTVFLTKGDPDAILHNMSYYKGCAKEGLMKPGGGTILLRFIYNHLKDNKKRYGINRIVLKDNSFVNCGNCSSTIKLARLKMVTDGYTWYSKYGFRPYDSEKRVPDKETYNEYKLNVERHGSLRTDSVSILNVLATIKTRKEEAIFDVKEVMRLAKKYTLMSVFIRRLVDEFSKYCCLINYVLDEVYRRRAPNSPLMYDMYAKTFYLDIP